MSIHRLVKTEKFFKAANAVFEDSGLSWEARGVMGYLLSKPDNWEVRFYDLVMQGPAGAHKIRRILSELEQAGYLRRERIALRDGTFDWISDVYESPSLNPSHR